MNVFELREELVRDYSSFTRSFITIRDPRLRERVEAELEQGLLWPEPLLQLNPAFAVGRLVDELVEEGLLHPQCAGIFRRGKGPGDPGQPLRLHHHQEEAIRVALAGHNYVLSTGTGSGKSLTYILPIVDFALRHRDQKGVKAIVVYPMNALANSQRGELEKFLTLGLPHGRPPVTFERYTGQESAEQRRAIWAEPPDILLTNYVMLELILTRPEEAPLVRAAQGLRFLVLDELHTYRGRQGADVALLVRRVREALYAERLQCIGTSATLSTEDTFAGQQRDIAAVASRLFGAEVEPAHVVGETLRRITVERPADDPAFVAGLQAALAAAEPPPKDFDAFRAAPLASWIETTFGLSREPESGRLVRATPRRITGPDGAGQDLARSTGAEAPTCVAAIQHWLLAGTEAEPDPLTGFPPFAFRLHQFISRGDTAYASLEPEAERYVTVQGQRFVPDGERRRVLLPLAFCRECGQEYYTVRRCEDPGTGRVAYLPRALKDRLPDEEGQPGFLYLSREAPWPDLVEEQVARLPDEWLEEAGDGFRVRPSQRRHVPRTLLISPSGSEDGNGLPAAYFDAPFRFCLRCGVSYRARAGTDDYGRLASLSSGGRSTATTLMTLRTVLFLNRRQELKPEARKLLSFTDNRQDASLQSGHFNDFIEVAALRGGLYRAVAAAGPAGLTHDQLTQAVFGALALPLDAYASDPAVRYRALEDTQQVLRNVLGYRLYADLRRGWRITLPNLEQCGLLAIRYESLDELCADRDAWAASHPLLQQASPEARAEVARVLLDYLRRELAIRVDYLTRDWQERLKQQSGQRLKPPWALDEDETLETARVVLPRPRPSREEGGADLRWNNFLFLSARGGFGLYLRRRFAPGGRLPLDETQDLISSLFDALRLAGLVSPVDLDELGTGWQVPADGMRWLAGEGLAAYHDPIRVPSRPEGGAPPNEFFLEFYRGVALSTVGISAREHTAQVPGAKREEREAAFRRGTLPILFCSPTMELGVDIAELNVVNLRNVPPTPANYAQRSGRAGRSGQPALVFSYCTSLSPHDQYFFKHPELMVAGKVTPPRLDLTNEDLLRAHVQAVFLAHSGASLGQSLNDVLDLAGDPPTLAVLPSKAASLADPARQASALTSARRVLATLGTELTSADWWRADWPDDVVRQAATVFDRACERWRSLYRAAVGQIHAQTRLVTDATRTHDEREQAKRLRREAEAQLELLTQTDTLLQSDFYSYRYFASEGFLPGYSFPRLPVSAFIPARRGTRSDEFLSRPRFLAISEFGPRALVYHEGSKYVINRVLLGVVERSDGAPSLPLGAVKQCEVCGYLHPLDGAADPDLCQHCQAPLPAPLGDLLRMQNVQTRRREKITADEEERQRLGFELRVGFRFAERDGTACCRRAEAVAGGATLATLTYGQAATMWRVNVGWRRRAEPARLGFVLDLERGYWAKNDVDPDDPDDPLSHRKARVIPYVEDHKSLLVLDPRLPAGAADPVPFVASLQSALKNAVQTCYQLEDAELAVEPLPSRANARMVLLYEAAEGGAGVLRRLLDDPQAVAKVARRALELCHFDPDTGADRRRSARAREDCEVACYDCLLSYTNQLDHQVLDRHLVRDYLLALARSTVAASAGPRTPTEHLDRLLDLCGSELERQWLRFLAARHLRLPSDAQKLIAAAGTRPDFYYPDHHAAVYVDGPVHDFPDRALRDRQQEAALDDLGIRVVRFGHADDWEAALARFPDVFGRVAGPSPGPPPEAGSPSDLVLFPAEWQEVVLRLRELGVTVEPGWDVTAGGRVVGPFPLLARAGERRLAVVDPRSGQADAVVEALRREGLVVLPAQWSDPQEAIENVARGLGLAR